MANIGDFEDFEFGVYLRVIREGKERKEKKKNKRLEPILTRKQETTDGSSKTSSVGGESQASPNNSTPNWSILFFFLNCSVA